MWEQDKVGIEFMFPLVERLLSDRPKKCLKLKKNCPMMPYTFMKETTFIGLDKQFI